MTKTANPLEREHVVMLDDGETFSTIKGSIVMALVPGDSKKLANSVDFVEPLNIYDLSDPADLRRLADDMEGASQ